MSEMLCESERRSSVWQLLNGAFVFLLPGREGRQVAASGMSHHFVTLIGCYDEQPMYLRYTNGEKDIFLLPLLILTSLFYLLFTAMLFASIYT